MLTSASSKASTAGCQHNTALLAALQHCAANSQPVAATLQLWLIWASLFMRLADKELQQILHRPHRLEPVQWLLGVSTYHVCSLPYQAQAKH